MGIYHTRVHPVSEYIPGEFYKRELPCILSLIRDHGLSPQTIIIDGYVYLDGRSTPGLGKHLYDALNEETRIVGVAKNAFFGIDAFCMLFRGGSAKPLFVTAQGMDLQHAKNCILAMHGKNRIPTLLKRADQEARQFSV
jgi:deoxyribonuclease V